MNCGLQDKLEVALTVMHVGDMEDLSCFPHDVINTALAQKGWDLAFTRHEWDQLFEQKTHNDVMDALNWDCFANIENRPSDLKLYPTEEPEMAIKHCTYIYGRDIDSMSVDEYLDAISRLDDEIKRYKDTNVESAVVTAKIAELNAQRAEIVALLDKKHG